MRELKVIFSFIIDRGVKVMCEQLEKENIKKEREKVAYCSDCDRDTRENTNGCEDYYNKQYNNPFNL